MISQPFRRETGGRVDRARPLTFSFDGKTYVGFAGDTLASALLANGVTIVGRSFKLHRPRGFLTCGVEEPNGLVTLRRGDRQEPNVPATVIELYDGLEAISQNRWPSLRFDVMSAIGLLAPMLAAGFYYKTFIGPTRRSWLLYERFIRRAAGMGEAPRAPDPDRYEKAHAFCDVLVVGAGAAGLAAALAAGRSGARVILADDGPEPGGALLSARPQGPEDAWRKTVLQELRRLSNVRIMTRTTVFGAYDGMTFGLIERVSDHLPVPAPYQPRQRYWRLHSRTAILATGMIERPLIFGNNDLPGVMLASAARQYLNQYGVLPGRETVVFTNNDSAYDAAFSVAEAGAKVSVVDARAAIEGDLVRRASAAGVALYPGCAVAAAAGRRRLREVAICAFDGATRSAGPVKLRLPCDLLLCSGGWSPTLHLLAQRGVKPEFDERQATFVAGAVPAGYYVAGGAAAARGLAAAAASGWDQGLAAAAACGFSHPALEGDIVEGLSAAVVEAPILPIWTIPDPNGGRMGMKFVDFQHDVKVDDLILAQREGYVSIEHLKRYTTLGMAADQGKTSNVNALGIVAAIRDLPVGDVGVTTFRPPYAPVAVGALAGPETGRHFRPVRRSPMHDWHMRNGAVLTDAGLWQRPWYYPRQDETRRQASIREAEGARRSVGMCDVSTLGKIDVQGPDATEFLDRVYVNDFRTLAVGRVRYGVMLRPDGVVFDDGTTSRIGEQHYFMTTTTANAGKVMTNLEFLLQTAWPELRVQVTTVTGQWAAIAVAGPRSREVLARVCADIDFDNATFPYMAVRHGHAGEIPVRILRVSFSGELAYEIYAPADFGEALWEAVHGAGREFGIVAYGVEAQGTLRIEKGHVAGPELDGRTSLADLGLARMASHRKPFVGSVLMRREGLCDARRPRLVGLELAKGTGCLRAGAILRAPGRPRPVAASEGGPAAHEDAYSRPLGFISSVTWSPELGKDIALGFVSSEQEREGDVIDALFPLYGETTPVRITSPRFVDAEGERCNA